MIRAFEIKATSKALITDIPYELDKKLCELQKSGWNILSITPINTWEWDYPKHFDSVRFVIIADDGVEYSKVEVKQNEDG